MNLVPPNGSRRLRAGGLLKTLLFAIIAITIIGAILASQTKKAQQDALAEADHLFKTKPAEAIPKYKEGYPAAAERKSEILQRIVDHEATSGNAAEATKWVERGLDDRVAVEYTVPAAKDLFAKVQKHRADRDAAKKSDEVARKADRDVKAKDREGKNRKYTRDEFKQLVVGKTRDEVITLLGKPKATQQSGDLELSDYAGRTTDPVTGKTDNVAHVEFDGDRVFNVTFIRI